MKDKPKGALLIGIGGHPEGGPEMDDEGGEYSSSEVKKTAARALMSALKASDVDAFSEALDAYLGV